MAEKIATDRASVEALITGCLENVGELSGVSADRIRRLVARLRALLRERDDLRADGSSTDAIGLLLDTIQENNRRLRQEP